MTEGTGPTDATPADDVPSDAMSRDVPPSEPIPGGEGSDRGNVPREVYEDGLESGADGAAETPGA